MSLKTCLAVMCIPFLLFGERMAVRSSNYFRGEHEFAERIRIAGRNLGWEVDICGKKCNPRSYKTILTVVPGFSSSSSKKDYLVLFDSSHHFFKSSGHLLSKYSDFAGYVATYPDTSLLQEDMQGSQSVYPHPWYPTVQSTPYVKVDPKSLFYFLCTWGKRANDREYKIFNSSLSKKPYARFYGKPEVGKAYKSAYKGEIPYDGHSTLSTISAAGVCLVLHSESHIEQKIPSARIFEAAAASAVIISDFNPFVVEQFGDSVLYIDQNKSGLDMVAQVDRHMQWILAHPAEAQEMARRAHEIFEEKFSLEDQLLLFDAYTGENE